MRAANRSISPLAAPFIRYQAEASTLLRLCIGAYFNIADRASNVVSAPDTRTIGSGVLRFSETLEVYTPAYRDWETDRKSVV